MLHHLCQLPTQAPSLPSSPFPSPTFHLRVSDKGTLSLSQFRSRRVSKSSRVRCASEQPEVAPSTLLAVTEIPTTVNAVVSVKADVGGVFAHVGISRVLDDATDLLGKSLLLELLSSELDPKTGQEKESIKGYAHRGSRKGEICEYECDFSVPSDFGEIGGVLVENEHHKEMYLNDILLTTSSDVSSTLKIDCRSWVHSKYDNPGKRIFFTSKSFLPSKTPSGLQRWREKELQNICGDGTGQRKTSDRIYDYDTYNDLGNPDSDSLARPVLGGSKELPYPRRCRTGRPRTKKDPLSEERAGSVYIPRDEAFSEVKQTQFSTKTLRSVVHALVPAIESAIEDPKLGFPYFTAIDKLYDEGVPLPNQQQGQQQLGFFRTFVPRLVKAFEDRTEEVLLFEPPQMMDRDKFSWFRDEEFSRQTLAGLNPLSIQLVKEFPLVSKLDPKIYGPPESAITDDIISREIRGVMTVQEAMKQKRLFMLDYHDLFLPYVQKVRELESRTLYGSRTFFFLTPEGTLKPIAIELTRPASPTKPQWKRVFTHCWDATGTWLWRLAKAHVCAHDSGYHQLVSHWLRTHCCIEPYAIALNRQLSAIHPIYRLMHPHFRYTMEINALAREYLISAGGIIETCFSPGKYSLELSAVAYREQWRFDTQALPSDLISRGMAVEDSLAEHGLRLTIEDYPYASDGLLVWSSVKQWVTDYVSHYYPSSRDVQDDHELQSWWTEVRTEGHADKKDEPWWPALKTPDDLIQILTTIIWVTSAHHSAVNFGQYHYAGYFPNRPTVTRINMPVEDELKEELAIFLKKPESTLLRTLPTQIQATIVIAILDILSTHAPDEEYLGGEPETAWAAEPVIKAAFERFNGRMKEIEGIIDARNVDPNLMNRCGAGIVPYELLKPFSEPGVTGKGIPNSISI